MTNRTNSVFQVRAYDRREPGGQQVVETSSGVSAYDHESRVGVIVDTEKSQMRNRKMAEALLAAWITPEDAEAVLYALAGEIHSREHELHLDAVRRKLETIATVRHVS